MKVVSKSERKTILAVLAITAGLAGVLPTEAAKVVLRITKWESDGILPQYRDNPGTYPVTQEKLGCITFSGAPDDCVRSDGTRIFDTTVASLEISTGENADGTFSGDEVVAELKRYEDVGLSVDHMLIFREDWLKRGTTGGPWEEDCRILSRQDIANVKRAISNSTLKCKDSLKILQLLGPRVDSTTVRGNRGDTWFDIVRNQELMEFLETEFDGVGTECHVGDYTTTTDDGQDTLKAMAAITKWTKDNNKLAHIFMGGTSVSYVQPILTRNTYNYLWNEMTALGVDKKSDHLIYFRQGARPGVHVTEADNSLSAQIKELISNVWTEPVGLDLGVGIDATLFDAESDPGNDNIIRIGSSNIGYIKDGSWIRFDDFNFDEGCGQIQVVASTPNSGKIEVRVGSPTGALLGTVNITSTGSWSNYRTFTKNISSRSGTKDLYFVFTGGSGGLFNLKAFTIFSRADARGGFVTENTSADLNCSGNWTTQSDSRDSGGSMKWSRTEGDTVKYTFTGDRAQVAVRKGYYGGACRILLDGNVVKNYVDTYASPAEYQQVIYDSGVLWTYGTHTIEVQVLGGNKNTMFDYFYTEK